MKKKIILFSITKWIATPFKRCRTRTKSSSTPSQAPQVGDTLFFGCGERKSCDETPGYNCCTHDNCNCYEDDDIECDEDRKRRDDGGDSGANSSIMGSFD